MSVQASTQNSSIAEFYSISYVWMLLIGLTVATVVGLFTSLLFRMFTVFINDIVLAVT